ncbi:MAG: exopolysaccharide production protein ExoQ [Bacteroidia bacterium]|jgi:exopolysaccharide production protein ExoQ
MARHAQIPWVIRNILTLLTVIMFIKVGGFFSVVEDRTLGQVFKVITRVGMTGLTLWIFMTIKGIIGMSNIRFKSPMPLILYVMYLTLGFISFTWSNKIQYSALQWFMTFESLVFVIIYMKTIALVNEHFPDFGIDLVKVFTRVIFFILLIMVIGSFIDPDTFYRGMRGGEEQRFGGYFMNPNELGMLASIGSALAFLYAQKAEKKFWPIAMTLLCIAALLMTASRSSLIGFLLIIGILIMKSEHKNLKIVMIIGGVLAVPVAVRFIIFKDGGGLDEVLSMTGRIPFWKALLAEGITREPFFGFGFMRIDYTDYFQGRNTYKAAMTHNTFMQVLLNVGFVGFFIVFWQVVSTFRNWVKEKGHRYSDFFIAMVIPVVINSLTEFGIFGDANYGILFWQFLIVLFIVEVDPKRSISQIARSKILQSRYYWNKEERKVAMPEG